MNSHRTHDRTWNHAMAHIHSAEQLLQFGGRTRSRTQSQKTKTAQSTKPEYVDLIGEDDNDLEETGAQPGRQSSTSSKKAIAKKTALPKTGARSSQPSRQSSTRSKKAVTASPKASGKAAAKGKAEPRTASSSQPSRKSSTRSKKAVTASPKASGNAEHKADAKGKAEPSTASSSQPSRHPIIEDLLTRMGKVDDKEIITGIRILNKDKHLAISRNHNLQLDKRNNEHVDYINAKHMKLIVDVQNDKVVIPVGYDAWIGSESVDAFLAMLENEDNNNLFVTSRLWIDYTKNRDRKYLQEQLKLYQKHCPEMHLLSKIFVPMNDSGAHWTLGVLDVKAEKIRYYDPSSPRSEKANPFPKKMEQLENFAQELLGIDMSIEYEDDYERQENGHDCGPFMCMYAYVESKYSSDQHQYVKPDIKQEKINDFRLFMTHTIFSAVTLESGKMNEWEWIKHLPPKTARDDGIEEYDITEG